MPTELGQLSALTSNMDLYSNKFSGRLPTEIGRLRNFTVQLSIDDNSLTGAIPTQLGRLTALTRIHGWKNSFSGSIPTQIGSMTAMTRLYLYSNNLCGSVPNEITSLTDSSSYTEYSLTTHTFVGPTPCPATSALVALYESTGGSSGGWTSDATGWAQRDRRRKIPATTCGTA